MVLSYQEKPLPEPYTIYIKNFDFTKFMEYANEDIDCELLDGELTIHSPASLEHELTFKFLLTFLDIHLHQNKHGTVVGSRFTMRLSDSWAPEPDVMFISTAREARLHDTYLDGAADVVFEILSPATRKDDVEKKLPKYLESGVSEVWMIDHESRVVTVHWKDENKKATRGWMASRYIPGFKVMVDWLWDPKKVDVLAAARLLGPA